MGHTSVSVHDVIEKATQQKTVTGAGSFSYPKQEFAYPDFREVLLAVAGDGGAINGKRLGKWLAAHPDRVVQGMRLVRRGLSAGILQ